MKKLILSLLAVGALTAAAQDNYWAPSTVISSTAFTAKSLNTSASGSTNAAATNIYTLTGKELGLQVNIGAQNPWGGNQSNLVLAISRSLDGLNWTTNNSVQLTANLTAAVTITTNITMNSARYVKLAVYTDALESRCLTNFQVIATSK